MLFGSPVAFAAPEVKTYTPGQLQSYLGLDFLYGNGYYDDSGTGKTLYNSSDYLYVMQIPFGARYSFNDSWAFGAEVQIGASESKTSDPIYKGTRSNSTLNEISIFTDFLLIENPIELIPELKFTNNLEKISETTDDVMTSEGVMSATAALRAQQQFGSFIVFGRLGYTYRSGGRSQLLPYSVAFAYSTPTYKMFGVEVSGFQSVSDDKDKDNSVLRNATISRTEAGVRRFYSINPSMTDVSVFANLNFKEKWKIDFNLGYIVAGTSYAQGIHGGLVLGYNFDLARKIKVEAPAYSLPIDKDSQISTDKEIENFKEEVNDGVDQELFKPTPTPKPVPKNQNPPPSKIKEKSSGFTSSQAPQKRPLTELEEELDGGTTTPNKSPDMKVKLRREKK